MKMKFAKYFLVLFLFVISLNISEGSFLKNKFTLQNHLSMMMKFKTKSRSMLENLITSANNVETKIKSSDKLNKEKTERKVSNQLKYRSKRFSTASDLLEEDNVDSQKYIQYRYKSYDDIVSDLLQLASKYPDYLQVKTAQELYNLPNPGGYCGKRELKEKCYHYIAFLTNHKISKENKHQIYISGEVHGNERVGPTATIELISLMLENKDNPWFGFLLDTRYIVITPMTNPHGYYDRVREELLIKDEDDLTLTRRLYRRTHKDINRDFPYLVQPESCMESIGARVVNELFIHHMFSLALSLHGGTESLTYPYGTPNHMVTKSIPKLPIQYRLNKNNELDVEVSPLASELVEKFRNGNYEMSRGKSTNPPDFTTLQGIANSASDHSTNNPKYKYKTGDMNSEVYSVTGGMEDWAYSGSWEGAPIINQCRPTTYKGYDINKTKYDGEYKDALKSIMFLLEVSHDKLPEQKLLGRKNLDCLINLRSNAFFNKLAENSKTCLDDYIDGYIPRIIRLSLTLIDILHPYITYNSEWRGKDYYIEWTVGGALNVDSTFILYDYFEDGEKIKREMESSLNLNEIKKLLTKSTREKMGKAVWNVEYSSSDRFKESLTNIKTQAKFLIFIIIAKVDKNWSLQNHPDPDVNPQTHIANFRTNASYSASNGGFTIQGQDFFKSDIKIVELN